MPISFSFYFLFIIIIILFCFLVLLVYTSFVRLLSFASLRKHVDVWCRENILFDNIYRCGEEIEEEI